MGDVSLTYTAADDRLYIEEQKCLVSNVVVWMVTIVSSTCNTDKSGVLNVTDETHHNPSLLRCNLYFFPHAS